jgi:hypothetical protein
MAVKILSPVAMIDLILLWFNSLMTSLELLFS